MQSALEYFIATRMAHGLAPLPKQANESTLIRRRALHPARRAPVAESIRERRRAVSLPENTLDPRPSSLPATQAKPKLKRVVRRLSNAVTPLLSKADEGWDYFSIGASAVVHGISTTPTLAKKAKHHALENTKHVLEHTKKVISQKSSLADIQSPLANMHGHGLAVPMKINEVTNTLPCKFTSRN